MKYVYIHTVQKKRERWCYHLLAIVSLVYFHICAVYRAESTESHFSVPKDRSKIPAAWPWELLASGEWGRVGQAGSQKVCLPSHSSRLDPLTLSSHENRGVLAQIKMKAFLCRQ